MMTSGDADTVKAAFFDAVLSLYAEDHDLFVLNVNERAVTHKLAEHLQREVDAWEEDWKVDCEYNRHGYGVKKLVTQFDAIQPHDAEAKTVFPDVVVHHRGDPDANLLVIEVKRLNGGAETFDREKVIAFTHPDEGFHYAHGIVLRLGKDGCETALVFRDGSLAEDWTKELQARLSEVLG